jgi:hypothetical protein
VRVCCIPWLAPLLARATPIRGPTCATPPRAHLQGVVARSEGGGGGLAVKIAEPMLSLVNRHSLRSYTLDRSNSAAPPVLTMVLS